ncbi:GntR family transcriptional regulator [Roseateles sp. DAIF2]|uniref:GntR family transcriptional regulator n=1 Tax=Roseateles sp. DAIF2 TaxID=2714952 RepID=UPI00201DA97D|nr:GntR family transcriptional regulator [Roseateles sp. DAIF2]
MEPLLPITIELPPPGSRRRGQALHQQLRTAILDGRLAPGLALPGTRALALACGVSRNGAVAAYERLLAEGLATARSGGATQVAEGVRPLAAAPPRWPRACARSRRRRPPPAPAA